MSLPDPARERWRKARALADKVADLPPHERSRILDEQCGADGETRRLIEAWLDADEPEDPSDPLTAGPSQELLGMAEKPEPGESEGDPQEAPAETPPTGDQLRIRRLIQQLEEEGLLDPVQGNLPPETTLGDFRLLRRVGSGGMGSVWLSEQLSLGQLVAVKVLHPGALASPNAIRGFEQEARALARLDHPHIVKVIAHGEAGGIHYLAMHLVRGKSLSEILKDRRVYGQEVEPRRCLEWARDIARALAAVHEEGILHRDVKPSNIRITPESGAVLVDFGIARDVDGTSWTRSRGWVGSPRYSSPEQVRGDRRHIGPQTDLYSLGVSLYECLAGNPPFDGDTTEGVFEQILHREPEALRRRNPAVPRHVETVVHKCLEKRTHDRYATAADLASDLQRLLDEQPPLARPPAAWVRARRWADRRRGQVAAGMATVALIALASTGWLARRAPPPAMPGPPSDAMMATALLNEAEGILEAYRDSRAFWAERDVKVNVFENDVQSNYMEPLPMAEGFENMERSRLARNARAELFAAATALLERARNLGGAARADRLELELLVEWLQELRPATPRATGTQAGIDERLRRKAALLDVTGEFTQEILGPAHSCELRTEPEGAQVYCFEYRMEGELHRTEVGLGQASDLQCRSVPCRVHPVDVGGPARTLSGSSLTAGSWCLRVVNPAPPLQDGDLIVELAGSPVEQAVYARDPTGKVYRLLRINGQQLHKWLQNKFKLEVPVRWDIDLIARSCAEAPSDSFFALATSTGESFQHQGRSLEEIGWRWLTASELAAEGNTTAQILRNGRSLELDLPGPVETRITASALDVHVDWAVGTTPLPTSTNVERAWRMLWLIQKAGYEPLRWVGPIPERPLRLLELGSTPAGFVRLPIHDTVAWLMETEVTAGEYLEFLNDPEVQERARRDGVDHAPRGMGEWLPNWAPDSAGRFVLPDGWGPRMPVAGVSHGDAQAFARWRTERARRGGEHYRFDLPSEHEWGSGLPRGWFGEGTQFRPHWVNNVHSRPRVGLEPVMSYPLDEWPTGAYDLRGSVHEWLRDDYLQSEGRLSTIGGGAWDKGRTLYFEPNFTMGHLSTEPSDSIGFRLIAYQVED